MTSAAMARHLTAVLVKKVFLLFWSKQLSKRNQVSAAQEAVNMQWQQSDRTWTWLDVLRLISSFPEKRWGKRPGVSLGKPRGEFSFYLGQTIAVCNPMIHFSRFQVIVKVIYVFLKPCQVTFLFLALQINSDRDKQA